MIGNNIKHYRMEKGYTQKDLADLLHVTAQAVSRWENGDVEPSIGTINEMVKIFEITTDELINGPSAKLAPEKIIEKEYVVKDTKPVLAVCEQCNKPIYDGNNIVRITHSYRGGSTQKIICKTCDSDNKAKALKAATAYGIEQRKRSFVWSGIISGVLLAVSLIVTLSMGLDIGITIATAVISVLAFPFVSCLFLRNNFVGEMVMEVASWGVVKFPGVLFSFDLGGIAWLIAIKLLFWVIGFTIGLAAIALALTLGLIVSPFVYPYALKKSFSNPELTDRF